MSGCEGYRALAGVYDLLNREIRRIERDDGVQRTVYDRNGQVVRLIHPNEYDRRRLPVHL